MWVFGSVTVCEGVLVLVCVGVCVLVCRCLSSGSCLVIVCVGV